MNKKLISVFLIFVMALLAAGSAGAADASFVIKAVDVLEEKYVDPVDRCALFNSAIEGLEKVLEEANLSAELESVPEDKCPEAQDRFVIEFARAAERVDGSDLDETKLAFGAVSYMAKSLNDSHVYFLNPERYHEREEMITGKTHYAGIGVTIHKADDNIYIVEVYDEAPAGGLLRPFDKIVTVNGQKINSETTTGDVVDLVRGEEGTGLTITIARQGIPESLGFTLQRASVKPPVVSSEMLAGNVGYLKIYTFERYDVSKEAISKMKKLSDEGMKALILDLRGNLGGFVSEVRLIAGTFLPKGVVLFRAKDNKTENVIAVDRFLFWPHQPYLSKDDIPVALLVNDDSASGSEVIGAAMQEYGRATIVGTQTAVAVDVGATIDLPEGAGMSITVSRVITPNGVALGKVGVTPDIVVPFESKDYALGRDPQLLRALEVAKSKIK